MWWSQQTVKNKIKITRALDTCRKCASFQSGLCLHSGSITWIEKGVKDVPCGMKNYHNKFVKVYCINCINYRENDKCHNRLDIVTMEPLSCRDARSQECGHTGVYYIERNA